jgi:predicted LPLAT superfamily acyltransferase
MYACRPLFLEGNKTITHQFLGAEAKFPAGPFVLASRFKAPVSFVYALKETTFHYHFYGSEIKEYLDLPKEALLQQVLHDFVSDMENKVKKYPEQWFNYFRRKYFIHNSAKASLCYGRPVNQL